VVSTGRELRLEVDTDRCIGSGQCVLTAPRVFDQRDEDGLVALRTARPPAELREDARTAVELCPAGAIRIGAPGPA
jgi:ferredoxin